MYDPKWILLSRLFHMQILNHEVDFFSRIPTYRRGVSTDEAQIHTVPYDNFHRTSPIQTKSLADVDPSYAYIVLIYKKARATAT